MQHQHASPGTVYTPISVIINVKLVQNMCRIKNKYECKKGHVCIYNYYFPSDLEFRWCPMRLSQFLTSVLCYSLFSKAGRGWKRHRKNKWKNKPSRYKLPQLEEYPIPLRKHYLVSEMLTKKAISLISYAGTYNTLSIVQRRLLCSKL